MLLEVILTLVIIVAVMLFVGVPLDSVISLLLVVFLGILVLSMTLFSLFFVITDVSLCFFRRVKGSFLRFAENERFDRAVYLVDGEEYTCLFPAENVARQRIYRDTERTLLISRSKKRRIAYDRHSMVIIAVGTGFAVLFITVLTMGALFLRKFL